MDRFEKDFENLDVQSAAMEGSMQATTTLNAPQHQVDSLMQQVADEAGCVTAFMTRNLQNTHHILIFSLELNLELPNAQSTTVGIGQSTKASQEQDELSQRLAALRGS